MTMSVPYGPSTTQPGAATTRPRPSDDQAAEELRPRGQKAAEKATEKNSTRVDVPLIGTVTLPPPQLLAYLGGIAALTALEVIEWPVGLALAAGHVLVTSTHNKALQEFGNALEEI